jgi:hypothetical protein
MKEYEKSLLSDKTARLISDSSLRFSSLRICLNLSVSSDKKLFNIM